MTLRDLGYPGNGNDLLEFLEGFCSITAALTARVLTLSASPAGSHTDPECNTVSLNSVGIRAGTDDGGNPDPELGQALLFLRGKRSPSRASLSWSSGRPRGAQ
jgi:hypothetical protein